MLVDGLGSWRQNVAFIIALARPTGIHTEQTWNSSTPTTCSRIRSIVFSMYQMSCCSPHIRKCIHTQTHIDSLTHPYTHTLFHTLTFTYKHTHANAVATRQVDTFTIDGRLLVAACNGDDDEVKCMGGWEW